VMVQCYSVLWRSNDWLVHGELVSLFLKQRDL